MIFNPVFLNLLQKINQAEAGSILPVNNPEFLFAELIKMTGAETVAEQNKNSDPYAEEYRLIPELNFSTDSFLAEVIIPQNQFENLISLIGVNINDKIINTQPTVKIVNTETLNNVLSDISFEHDEPDTYSFINKKEHPLNLSLPKSDLVQNLLVSGRPVVITTKENPLTQVQIELVDKPALHVNKEFTIDHSISPSQNLKNFNGLVFNSELLKSFDRIKLQHSITIQPGQRNPLEVKENNHINKIPNPAEIKINPSSVLAKAGEAEEQTLNNRPIFSFVSRNHPLDNTFSKTREVPADINHNKPDSKPVSNEGSIVDKQPETMFRVIVAQKQNLPSAHPGLKTVEETFPKIRVGDNTNSIQPEKPLPPVVEQNVKKLPVNTEIKNPAAKSIEQFTSSQSVIVDETIEYDNSAKILIKAAEKAEQQLVTEITKPEVNKNITDVNKTVTPPGNDQSSSFNEKNEKPDLHYTISNIVNETGSGTKSSAASASNNVHIKTVHIKNIEPEIIRIVEKGDSKTLELQLIPKEFGKVKVLINSVNKVISLNIEVENETVKEALQASLANLSAKFSNDNLILNSISIHVMTKEGKQDVHLLQKRKVYKAASTVEQNKSEPAMPKNLGYNTYDYII